MANSTKYWKGLEQLEDPKSFEEANRNEFAEDLPVVDFLQDKETLEESTTTRRDFLKYLGFGVAAASLAACETPVTKAIPYLNKPEEVTPGVANYYASTYYDGQDYCPVLVKTREGRPIFVKGNASSPLTGGEINARVNASVLSLYDNNRLKNPLIGGKAASWKSIDETLTKEIKGAKNLRILSSSVISPSTREIFATVGNTEMVDEEGNMLPSNNLVEYDAISYSGILDANKESFGKRVIPTYNFLNAKTVVSIGADFLSGWLDAMQYSNGYTKRRKPEGEWMSEHYQFEANMSLTGTNADVRVPVKPSEYGAIVAALYSAVSGSKVNGGKLSAEASKKVASAAKSLSANKGESIVVCGSNDKNVQVLVNALNNALGNYGKTIDIDKASNSKRGSDAGVAELVKEMESGKVDALLIYGVDPVYTMGSKFAKAMKKVKTTVSFATKMNDTAATCKYVCPDNHWLESWNDANPVTGHYSLGQPTISPLFDTRQAQESILKWTGNDTSYYDYIQAYWERNLFPGSGVLVFADFWNKALHDGVYEAASMNTDAEVAPVAEGEEMMDGFNGDVNAAAAAVAKMKVSGTELTLYLKEGIGSGSGADNPILQELPDPVTKITWDNYVTMNPSEMKEKGFNTVLGQENPANMLSVSANGATIELPVIAQPGQAKGTIGIALGYGKKVGKMEEATGKNAFPMVAIAKNGAVSYTTSATITPIEGEYPIAATQTHQTVMGRDSVIRETTLDVFKNGSKDDYNPIHTLLAHEDGHAVKKPIQEFDLWGAHPVKEIGHRWGMSIDMNTCTGCGACITACNLENNVPVVGKDEVRRGREMHWLRIDRYYSSEHEPLGAIGDTHEATMEATEKGAIGAYTEMESAASADKVRVVHQPMMCQHCNHAGCETVCPVAATTHSNEGLNMMAYNRCIGTRYCANNCAYKVRRFNWFNYTAYHKFTDVNPAQDDLGRMVLNPDVVVRTRGVMEKCSLCVQNIQAGKLEAKKAGTPVMDGSIQTACSSACGSGAITFGDLNDKDSKVRAGMDSDRSYRVIEEVGQDPNIYYQVKVRNVNKSEA